MSATKNHLNVDVILTSLPNKVQKVVEIIINLVLCGFFVFLIVIGYQFAIGGMRQTTSYLPLPMTAYYASIPSAAVLMLYYMIKNIIGQFRNFNKEEEKK